mmetsp:Transcript_1200/g.1752  ORF Transcript_1200/g.1752 Transcript_1200/m.1752 type:complete len:187 (+) Transcript_1200:150-710(+)
MVIWNQTAPTTTIDTEVIVLVLERTLVVTTLQQFMEWPLSCARKIMTPTRETNPKIMVAIFIIIINLMRYQHIVNSYRDKKSRCYILQNMLLYRLSLVRKENLSMHYKPSTMLNADAFCNRETTTTTTTTNTTTNTTTTANEKEECSTKPSFGAQSKAWMQQPKKLSVTCVYMEIHFDQRYIQMNE